MSSTGVVPKPQNSTTQHHCSVSSLLWHTCVSWYMHRGLCMCLYRQTCISIFLLLSFYQSTSYSIFNHPAWCNCTQTSTMKQGSSDSGLLPHPTFFLSVLNRTNSEGKDASKIQNTLKNEIFEQPVKKLLHPLRVSNFLIFINLIL